MTILASLWKTLGIGGSAAVLLGLALAVSLWNADRISGQRDAAIEARIACETRHGITAASLDRLQAEIETLNEAARQRAETYENSLRIARERANENERRAVASNAKIARLEALAGQDGVCQVPEELEELVDGL